MMMIVMVMVMAMAMAMAMATAISFPPKSITNQYNAGEITIETQSQNKK